MINTTDLGAVGHARRLREDQVEEVAARQRLGPVLRDLLLGLTVAEGPVPVQALVEDDAHRPYVQLGADVLWGAVRTALGHLGR